MAAAPLPHHSNHDNDTCRFVHDDPLAATPRIDSPCPQSRSRSSSPSRLRHSLVIDEQLIHSEHPHSQALSIKRNPTDKSGESREKLELSTTSKARDYFSQILLTRNIHPVITVQNSGSVARDHLASERTFLAYVRTSLGLAGAGVALVQLFTMSSLTSKSTGVPLPAATQRLQKFAAPLGLAAIGLALVVLFTGASRYFLVQNALCQNKFPTARLSIMLICFGLGAITVTAFGALLSGKVEHI